VATSGPTIHAKPSRQARQTRHARLPTSSPTIHVKPDNPRQARQSTSGPTIHAKPSRPARPPTSSPTIHVKPDHPRQARQSTSGPTDTRSHPVKPDHPCEAIPSGPTIHVRPDHPRAARQSMRSHPVRPERTRQPLTQHLAHGHVRRCAPIAQTATPSICYTSRPRKKDLDHAVPSIERTRYVLLRL
jgi:hypothetical protein